MRFGARAIGVWWAGFVLALLMAWPTVADASTFNSGTSNCAGCHGGTPPNLPSQGSNILNSGNVNYTDSCAGGPCSLRTEITNNGNMGAGVAGNFNASELETIRVYLLNSRTLTFSNTAPSFTSTTVGFTTTDTFTFTMNNFRGDTVSYSVSIGGANPGDFAIQSRSQGAGCNASSINAATSLSPIACTNTITVIFQPTATGTRNATLLINLTSADGADPAPTDRSVALSGVGLTPESDITRSPASLTLSARIGQTDSGTVTITNQNSATANLVLSSLTFSGTAGVFSRSGTCVTGGGGMPPNTSCTVIVTYTASAAGAQNGTLTIGHNDPDFAALTVTLNATGTQSLINPTAATVAFGNVQQGNNRVLTQNVGNTGTATLNFTAPLPNSPAALSGAAAGDYTVGGCAAVVGPGLSCTLSITFTPTALGSRPATLTISSDATNGPLVISLTGAGVILPEPVVTGPSSDFPDTVINEVSAQTRTITITNPRTNAIVYSVAAITDFSIDAESCPTRNVPGGGASCTLTITFRPLLPGGETRRTGTYAFAFTGTGGNPDPSPVNVSVAGNALLPLNLSATTINAAAVVGSPTNSSVVLTNRASTPLTLTTLVFTGAAAADYSLAAGNTCTAGLAMAASSSCTLIVRFNPPAAGTRNATLTITHSAAGSPQTVSYLGTATPAPQGRIELSATNVVFADTQLLSTSSQNVVIQNSGDLALTFSAFTFGGANAGDFTRSGTCSTATPLAIGAQCTLTVTFAPSALGVRSANLVITSDASNGAATITLSGNGVPIPAPQVTLAPATLDFGTQTIGGLYPARTVRLTNSGTADLAVASIVVAGAGFTQGAATCPAVLAPGAGCDISISFAATATTLFTGTLTVTSNAAGSPHVTALVGTGSATAVPTILYSPAVTSLDFGSVSVGSVSAVQTVTIQNMGPGGVTLTLLNAVGPDASAFSVVGGTCNLTTILFETQTCSVDIRFAPGSAGAKTAQVQIASTGSFPPVLTLTGLGLAGPNPSFSLSTTNLTFQSTRVGAQSLPETVRLTASGSGVVTVSAIDVIGAYALLSTTCPALPFTLPAGAECSVSVEFRPNSEGLSTGTLRITSDAAPAVRDIALAGNGEGEGDVSSGGCTIGDGTSPLDPTLWLMLLGALAVLWRRPARRRVVPPRAGAARRAGRSQ